MYVQEGECGALTALHLGWNSLTSVGASHLAYMIKMHPGWLPRLENLYLETNAIDGKPWKIFCASSLFYNSMVMTIAFFPLFLGVGVASIIEAWDWNGRRPLKLLSLSHNQIGRVGMDAMVASMKLAARSMSSLLKLSLSSNEIDDAGACLLASALPAFKDLRFDNAL